MSTNLYPVLTFESLNTINDKTKRGNVVTTQISKDEWLATYPGFSATAPTETHALERLAQIIERTCVSIRGIANALRHGHEPLREDQKHKPIRFNIGEFLILTCDCELGKAGDTDANHPTLAKLKSVYEAAQALCAQPMITKGDGATWGDVAQSHKDGPKLLSALVKAINS